MFEGDPMTDQRADVDRVSRLVTAALAGIKTHSSGTTPSDVISACLTITKMAIDTVLEMSESQDLETNRTNIRAQVEVLLMATLARETPRA